MAIGDDEVKAIARLARIEIHDDDIPEFTQQLGEILEFVAQMDAVDTRDVEPLAHPVETRPRTRADVVLESDLREIFQATAPHVENALYVVPKVIE